MNQPLLRTEVGSASVFCSGSAHGNVGSHVGDDPDRVARHRARVAELAGLADPASWVWLHQVHGATVFDADAGGGAVGAPPEADAALTTTRGLPLAIVTADCAPVVVANDTAMAAVHAGHRGLLAGVVEAAVDGVRTRGTGQVRAFLGPCIRPASYEFGEADLEPLVERFGAPVVSKTADGRPALDIPAAVRLAVGRAGVDALEDCGHDTASMPAYFSYRRDRARGRQVTIAVLR